MSDDTLVVLIVFGSIFGIVFVSMLFSLAQKWIKRKDSSYDEEKFDRLAKAFIKYKKDSERRLQNLEAVISEDNEKAKDTSESSSNKSSPLKETQLHNAIEIDDDEKKQQQKESGGNLRNMLKE